jgi:hypothetical protein
MLARYRESDQVMCVSGNNFLFDKYRPDASYCFSRYALTWGWATWKRAWRHYDGQMLRWPEVQDSSWLREVLKSETAARYWKITLGKNHETLENWDYAWIFSCWLRGGLTVIPEVNIVRNLGFREDATHTFNPGSRFARLPMSEIKFPLRHPAEIQDDEQADHWTERNGYSGEYFLESLFHATRRHIKATRTGHAG